MSDHSHSDKQNSRSPITPHHDEKRGGTSLPAVHRFGLAPVQPKTEKHWLVQQQEGKEPRSLPAVPMLQNKPVQKKELEELPVQGKLEPSKPFQLPEAPVQKKPNRTGLPDNLKEGVENLSGHSMDDVKVHYNSDKPAQLQALAYAQGADIHIGPGQEKHLPHEAWHVVQQKQGRVQPTMQMKAGISVNDDKQLEQEADVMGREATKGNYVSSEPLKNTATDMQAQSPPVQRVLITDFSAKTWKILNSKEFKEYLQENRYFTKGAQYQVWLKNKQKPIIESYLKGFLDQQKGATVKPGKNTEEQTGSQDQSLAENEVSEDMLPAPGQLSEEPEEFEEKTGRGDKEESNDGKEEDTFYEETADNYVEGRPTAFENEDEDPEFLMALKRSLMNTERSQMEDPYQSGPSKSLYTDPEEEKDRDDYTADVLDPFHKERMLTGESSFDEGVISKEEKKNKEPVEVESGTMFDIEQYLKLNKNPESAHDEGNVLGPFAKKRKNIKTTAYDLLSITGKFIRTIYLTDDEYDEAAKIIQAGYDQYYQEIPTWEELKAPKPGEAAMGVEIEFKQQFIDVSKNAAVAIAMAQFGHRWIAEDGTIELHIDADSRPGTALLELVTKPLDKKNLLEAVARIKAITSSTESIKKWLRKLAGGLSLDVNHPRSVILNFLLETTINNFKTAAVQVTTNITDEEAEIAKPGTHRVLTEGSTVKTLKEMQPKSTNHKGSRDFLIKHAHQQLEEDPIIDKQLSGRKVDKLPMKVNGKPVKLKTEANKLAQPIRRPDQKIAYLVEQRKAIGSMNQDTLDAIRKFVQDEITKEELKEIVMNDLKYQHVPFSYDEKKNKTLGKQKK